MAVELQPSAERPLHHHLYLEPALGIGTPIGLGGLSIIVRPMEALSLSAGAGASFDGAQIAVGGRVHVKEEGSYDAPGDKTGISLGAGWSMGNMDTPLTPKNLFSSMGHTSGRFSSPRWEPAHRLNLDLSLHVPLSRSVGLRTFAGIGVVLNGPTNAPSYRDWIAFFGFGLPIGFI